MQIKELPASFHSGSADTFYAGVLVYPRKETAVVVVVNAAGPKVDTARDRATSRLLRQFGALG